MLHDYSEKPSSVDAKTAEETLALALRLQQERGERVSLEELQRTADEAGIDRVYLEGALRQVAKKAQMQEQLQEEEQLVVPRQKKRFIVMGIAMAVAILITTIGRVAPEVVESPFFFIVLISAAIAARTVLVGRKSGAKRRWFRD